MLFQKIQHGARDGARTGCVPRRENPLFKVALSCEYPYPQFPRTHYYAENRRKQNECYGSKSSIISGLLLLIIHYIHDIDGQPLSVGARSYFSQFSFQFHLKNHHSKDCKFKILVKTVQVVWMLEAILFLTSYTLLFKLNYGYHNQTYFH